MNTFGDLIKAWRGTRRLSQLALSVEAEVSARHISFLESGRARPSRPMVLQLAEVLQMPRPDVNRALLAAGFAPAFPQRPAEHDELVPVREALATLLANHEPLPAIVLDRSWNLVNCNAAARWFLPLTGLAGHNNMIDALIADDEATSVVDNWHEVAALTLARLRTELFHAGNDPTLRALIDRLATHPRLVREPYEIDLDRAVIPARFSVHGRKLALFSTLTQFGTVQDLALGDVRIEMLFPADATTRRFFETCAR